MRLSGAARHRLVYRSLAPLGGGESRLIETRAAEPLPAVPPLGDAHIFSALLKVHGVSIYITARLPRPLPAMIRTWIRANQHEDLPGSLTALENALASRQQKRLTAKY